MPCTRCHLLEHRVFALMHALFYLAFQSKQRMSSINGYENDIGITFLFKFESLPTSGLIRSFFFTTTKGNDQGDCDMSSIFALIISAIALLIICL